MLNNILDKAEQEFDKKYITFRGGHHLGKHFHKSVKTFLRTSITEAIRAALESVRLKPLKRDIQTASDSVCHKCGFPNDHQLCACLHNSIVADLDEKIDNLMKE